MLLIGLISIQISLLLNCVYFYCVVLKAHFVLCYHKPFYTIHGCKLAGITWSQQHRCRVCLRWSFVNTKFWNGSFSFLLAFCSQDLPTSKLRHYTVHYERPAILLCVLRSITMTTRKLSFSCPPCCAEKLLFSIGILHAFGRLCDAAIPRKYSLL